MDINNKINFWQYCKDNPMIFPAGAIGLGIGIFSLADQVYSMAGFMGLVLVVLIGGSIIDWKKKNAIK